MKRHLAHRRLVVLLLGLAVVSGACATDAVQAARCDDQHRLALVAQAVPDAAYVPCVSDLRPGWRVADSRISSSGVRIALASDRSPGQPVEVEFDGACDVLGAVATTPRAEGVRTHIRLASITPRYAGVLYDVFPGGCVSYQFDFERGAHIALMEEFQAGVELYPRRQLRVELRDSHGVELDP